MKSIRLADLNLPRSQEISCIGYNVTLLYTAVAAIFRMRQIRVRGLGGMKAISKCEVNQTGGFQDIALTINFGRTGGQTDGRMDRHTDRQMDRLRDRQAGPLHKTSRLSTGVSKLYLNIIV